MTLPYEAKIELEKLGCAILTRRKQLYKTQARSAKTFPGSLRSLLFLGPHPLSDIPAQAF
jgi:hypothetical protein